MWGAYLSDLFVHVCAYLIDTCSANRVLVCHHDVLLITPTRRCVYGDRILFMKVAYFRNRTGHCLCSCGGTAVMI